VIVNLIRLIKRSVQAAKHASVAAASGLRNAGSLRSLKRNIRRSAENLDLVAIGLVEHIGDIVSSEPVVRHIREKYSAAFLIWCVREPYCQLAESFGLADAVVSVNCLTEWILLRKLAPFDDVVDLHINGQACSICPIPLKKTEDNSGINIRNYYNFGSLTEVRAKIAGIALADTQPRLQVPESVTDRVDSLELPDRFVTIHARSEQTVRDWVDERWFKLAENICGELNISLVEIGLVTCMPSKPNGSHIIDLCGRLSLLETAEVIRRSEIFIGIDSGPAHLANAVGTPGIILLGSYFGLTSRVPYSGSYSRPEKCQIIRTSGPMENISVEEVFAAAKMSLNPERIG
jgi:ADP-heptose:LPS heptosyltransferase